MLHVVNGSVHAVRNIQVWCWLTIEWSLSNNLLNSKFIVNLITLWSNAWALPECQKHDSNTPWLPPRIKPPVFFAALPHHQFDPALTVVSPPSIYRLHQRNMKLFQSFVSNSLHRFVRIQTQGIAAMAYRQDSSTDKCTLRLVHFLSLSPLALGHEIGHSCDSGAC